MFTLSTTSDNCRDDYIRLAVPQSTVGSLVASMGSMRERDSFLGAAEDDGL